MRYLVIIIALLFVVNSEAQSKGKDNWVKKTYTIKGGWSISETTLKLDSNFKTSSGPDLKIYLSKLPMSKIKKKTNILNKSVQIGLLKKNKGAQIYKIPKNMDLKQYKSIVIYCEAYTVVWGGVNYN